jgi:broad specificity phosphatase PhoE
VTTILLTRHGETDWNAASRFQGHADPPLNDRGREQARALARELAAAPPDALYSSPLRRAAETAAIVADHLGLEVCHVEDLREIDVGDWQGLTRAEVDERYPGALGRWLAGAHGWENGETYDELAARVLAALHRIAAGHLGQRVLVVAHGGPIRTVRAHVERTSVVASRRAGGSVGNCTVFPVEVVDGTVSAAWPFIPIRSPP